MRMRAWKMILAIVAPLWAAAAWAAPPGLESGGGAIVTEIIDGDTVVLEDGREVRLVGIQAPKLALGRANFREWPLAEESKAALEALVRGKTVELYFGGRRQDRHGRTLAHLYGAGESWAQGEMLRLGLARVYSFADNRALVADMLAIEREARAARRGIWGHSYYRVLAPAESGDKLDSFQIVEGRVLDAAIAGGRAYLNFGADWRTDFTLVIDGPARRRFADSGVDPQSLEGKMVRARGWIDSFNGPMIEITHPEQIEVAEP